MTRFVILLAATAMLAGCGRHDGGDRRLGRDETLVRVSATATAEAKPDEARFSIGMSSIADTADAATAANATRMNAVVARLKALGVADKDLQTRQLSVGRIGYGANRNRFEASNIVEARVRDIAKASDAIAAATREGANVLSGPDFRVGDPEAASRSAYAQAYRAARARADAYAAAAGMSVARVLAIVDGAAMGAPNPLVQTEQAMAPPPVLVGPPVMPGTNSGMVTVTADFALVDRQ